MLITDEQLIGKVSAVVRPFGCKALALGPHTLRQKDYGHVYGPSVIVKSYRRQITSDDIAEMTAEVTTKVPGIAGVSVQL